ncbi:MAG TPA: hypothetical protein VK780_05025 [Thermoanaerobaculia bacterium]|jgi:hypothetical protein|nr:hypothetical protein [Thermoanaerobaculia bacterium]
MKTSRSIYTFAIGVLTMPLLGAGVAAKKTALITIPATFEVNATPTKVWASLTSIEGFGTLTGFQPQAGQKPSAFSKVGDHLLAQVWEDKGRLIVTEFVPVRELRVAWEPEKGHYLCQKRVVLSPSGGGTSVEYWDRYTDDQLNADDTAKQVVADTEKHIEAFRRLVEK